MPVRDNGIARADFVITVNGFTACHHNAVVEKGPALCNNQVVHPIHFIDMRRFNIFCMAPFPIPDDFPLSLKPVSYTHLDVYKRQVFNVIMGERYKMVTKEFKGLVRGEYGRTPVKIDPEFRKKIIGDAEPIDCRPADLLEPELDKLRAECADWMEQEEDVLSYAQFGQVAVKFFENRRNKKLGIDSAHADAASQVHPV